MNSSVRWMMLALPLPILAVTFMAASRNGPEPRKDEPSRPSLAERGALLVMVGGCNDCHTPMYLDESVGMPVHDFQRMLSGHPEGAPDPRGTLGKGDQALVGATFTSFRLPFGTVYASNLTPDKETGLGNWTAEQFIEMMRTGRHQHHHEGEAAHAGRPILPPMPWFNLAAMPEEELRAIFAYLQSVPPIRNRVPAPDVPPEAMEEISRAYDRMAAKKKGSR